MPTLLILIPIAWTVLVLLVLAACRSAARSEKSSEASAAERTLPVVAVPGLTVWDCPDEETARPLAKAITGSERARVADSARKQRRPHHERLPETVGTRSR